MSRVLAKRTLGTGSAQQWGFTRLSLALDESSQAANPIFCVPSASPALTVGPVGSGSIPAPSGTTAGRSVAAVITDFVINYPKTWIEENLSQRKISALCSKVLDLFRLRLPVVACSATLEPHSSAPAETAVARPEAVPALAPASRRGTHQESAFFVCDSPGRPTLSHAECHPASRCLAPAPARRGIRAGRAR